MKKFKKIICSLLCMSMILSITSTAFAAQPQRTRQDEIIGEVIYEDTIVVDNQTKAAFSSTTNELHTLVSVVEIPNSTVTYYGYTNDVLTQYHSTIPGSGILTSTYINADGSERTETTITKQNNSPSSPIMESYSISQDNQASTSSESVSTFSRSDYTNHYSNINSPTSVRPLGYMHYRNTFTDTLFSIDCEVKERYHQQEEYTFNANVGGEISFWLGVATSVFSMSGGGPVAVFVNNFVKKWISKGLIVLGFGTTYMGVGSKTIKCNWFEQEIHGTPVAPANRGDEVYLSGIYAFVDYDDGNGVVVETEGYTVSDWGDISMGRWMMYNVFGIDEHPWFTNTNFRSIPAQ